MVGFSIVMLVFLGGMFPRNWVNTLQAQGLRWRINGNAVKQEMQRQGGGLSYGIARDSVIYWDFSNVICIINQY